LALAFLPTEADGAGFGLACVARPMLALAITSSP
jgi:hypothetical protein